VYTKSSCWKGAGWSVTGRDGGERASQSGHAPPGQGATARLDQVVHPQIGSAGFDDVSVRLH
jgi:hypothetical protein